jgi:drug/metabolite transporter (DMT)-like permease
MLFLVLAIVGSGIIPIIFRAFDGWRISLFWAIPANYITCVLVGNFLAGNSLNVLTLISQSWIWFAALQGTLLAVNFYLLAHTAQRAGVAIAALASRLSVAIPSLLAFLLYGDSLTVVKLAGLFAALLGLYLCTAPERDSGALKSRLFQLLPILVFVTFACYFSILKYLQAYYLDASSYHYYVMSGFVFALVSSVFIGIGKRVFSPRGIPREAYPGWHISRLHQLHCRLCAAQGLSLAGLGKFPAFSHLQRRRRRCKRSARPVVFQGKVIEAENRRPCDRTGGRCGGHDVGGGLAAREAAIPGADVAANNRVGCGRFRRAVEVVDLAASGPRRDVAHRLFLDVRGGSVKLILLYLLLLKATATSFSGLSSLPVLREDLVVRRALLTDHQLNVAVTAGRVNSGE